MGPLNQYTPFQHSESLFNDKGHPAQQEGKLSIEKKAFLHAKESKNQQNAKWIPIAKTALAITGMISTLSFGGYYLASHYFDAKTKPLVIVPSINTYESTEIAKVVTLVIVLGAAILMGAKTLFSKNSDTDLVNKNKNQSSTPLMITSKKLESKNENAPTDEATKRWEGLEKVKLNILTDEKSFLAEYEKAIEYLKKLELPLNEDQTRLTKSLVNCIETMITPPGISCDRKVFSKIINTTFSILLNIDKNSALKLFDVCVNQTKKKPFFWECGMLVQTTSEAIDIEENILLSYVEKFNKKSISIDDCKTIIKFLRKTSLPILNENRILLIQALTTFIIEKINNPMENDPIEKELPTVLKSLFELLLYRFEDYESLYKIAKNCIRFPANGPEKLKNQCNTIVKDVLQHNKSIALKLINYCAKHAGNSNQESTTNHLVWFLEAESYRIDNSLENYTRKKIDAIYNRYPRKDTFDIRSSLFLCPFLRQSSKIDNIFFQNCIINAFDSIIKQNLKKHRNYDSPITECTFKFLIRENVKNYKLALSLLKIYISSKASKIPKFAKKAYEELVIHSPETAKELATYLEETKAEALTKYIRHSIHYWSSQDDTPKSHAELKKNGILQFCRKGGMLPYSRDQINNVNFHKLSLSL